MFNSSVIVSVQLLRGNSQSVFNGLKITYVTPRNNGRDVGEIVVSSLQKVKLLYLS